MLGFYGENKTMEVHHYQQVQGHATHHTNVTTHHTNASYTVHESHANQVTNVIREDSSFSLGDFFMSWVTKGEMDGKTFAKFSKDNQLLNKNLTSTDIDLIFEKVKTKGKRTIS